MFFLMVFAIWSELVRATPERCEALLDSVTVKNLIISLRQVDNDQRVSYNLHARYGSLNPELWDQVRTLDKEAWRYGVQMDLVDVFAEDSKVVLHYRLTGTAGAIVETLKFLNNQPAAAEAMSWLAVDDPEPPGNGAMPTWNQIKEAARLPADPLAQLLRTPLTKLRFSTRVKHALQNENLVFLGDLVQRTETELLRFANFGRVSLVEVEGRLGQLGLTLGMKVSRWPDVNTDPVSMRFILEAVPSFSVTQWSERSENQAVALLEENLRRKRMALLTIGSDLALAMVDMEYFMGPNIAEIEHRIQLWKSRITVGADQILIGHLVRWQNGPFEKVQVRDILGTQGSIRLNGIARSTAPTVITGGDPERDLAILLPLAYAFDPPPPLAPGAGPAIPK